MANKQNLQSLLDVRQHQLDFIFNSGESLNNKALAVLGFDSAALVFIVQSLNGLSWWAIMLPAAFFLLSLLCAARVMWPTAYQGAGVDPQQYAAYLELSEEELHLQLLADTEVSIRYNTKLNAAKLKYCF